MTTSPRLVMGGFPDDLKRRLKANAALAGVSMSRACIIAIEDWCQDRETERQASKDAATARTFPQDEEPPGGWMTPGEMRRELLGNWSEHDDHGY